MDRELCAGTEVRTTPQVLQTTGTTVLTHHAKRKPVSKGKEFSVREFRCRQLCFCCELLKCLLHRPVTDTMLISNTDAQRMSRNCMSKSMQRFSMLKTEQRSLKVYRNRKHNQHCNRHFVIQFVIFTNNSTDRCEWSLLFSLQAPKFKKKMLFTNPILFETNHPVEHAHYIISLQNFHTFS